MQGNSLPKLKITFKTKIILIISGFFLFLMLLEIGLRVGGFILLSMQEYRNSQTIKQKGTYRIMCIGESTTARQYPTFLEEILNQRDIGLKFSVIDKGVIATNTSAILLGIEENLNKYKPDMVIAMMGNNDKYIMYYKDIPETQAELFQHCRAYRFMRLIYMHILDKLKKAIELKHETDTAYIRLGRLYQNQGRISEAAVSFKKAIELNPKNDRAFTALGEVWRSERKFSQSEESFKKAIELNPKNNNAYLELGRLYQNQGRISEAAVSFKKAIELNPKNSEPYIRLGRLYKSQGRISEAAGSFKKAIELDPKNDRACAGLAELYWDRGKLSRAEEVLNKFLALNPKNDWVYMALANLYREMNRAELAEEYKKKVNELRLSEYSAMTIKNYLHLKEILDKRGMRLVCVQYPMRSIGPLKEIFEDQDSIIFVDNEGVFKDALKNTSYKEYFVDIFAGDFGHCTRKGNRLLAENIANTVLKEVFIK